MANQNQNSIISYVPQPYFIAGTCTIAGFVAIASLENTPGIFDPDLSNFTTVVPTSGVGSFAVQIDYAKQSAQLVNSDMSLGLIGCSLLTYADSGGSPDLDTEFSENITCLMSSNVGTVVGQLESFAHNSQDSIHTFCRDARPSVISGGRANLLFNGLGLSSAGATATVFATFERVAADVTARPHVRLNIGHLFVGVDIPVVIDPRSFSWTIQVENERFRARDFGSINSDGTLVKRSAGEVIKIPHNNLIGSEVTGLVPDVVASSIPNFFDLIKVGTSYPMLFNPYPVPEVTASTLTLDEANLTARQNFFSIYGFMDDPLELLTDELRDGLNSEYRARYRIIETR